jgi:hypothetical protein
MDNVAHTIIRARISRAVPEPWTSPGQTHPQTGLQLRRLILRPRRASSLGLHLSRGLQQLLHRLFGCLLPRHAVLFKRRAERRHGLYMNMDLERSCNDVLRGKRA